jgi:hypothetical protein
VRRALISILLLGPLLTACGAGESTAPHPAPQLCSYRNGTSTGTVFAPCEEGQRFADTMRQLGFPDNADVYMPQVAQATCEAVAAGRALQSYSSSPRDEELQRAYRQAEIAARCLS